MLLRLGPCEDHQIPTEKFGVEFFKNQNEYKKFDNSGQKQPLLELVFETHPEDECSTSDFVRKQSSKNSSFLVTGG